MSSETQRHGRQGCTRSSDRVRIEILLTYAELYFAFAKECVVALLALFCSSTVEQFRPHTEVLDNLCNDTVALVRQLDGFLLEFFVNGGCVIGHLLGHSILLIGAHFVESHLI